MSDSAFCNLCDPPRRMPLEEIVQHLDRVHGQTVEFETWPDGEVVIHDDSLEPRDFEPSG